MSKGQRGNREAKKPKKTVTPPLPGNLPVLPLPAPERPRHK
jgi:hypothetical protein